MTIDPDIRRARTLPSSFYEDVQRALLRRSFHLAPPLGAEIGSVTPFEIAGVPLVMVRGEDRVRCMSNVCTHRANLVVEGAGCVKSLRCRYHGRRFSLDGTLVSMPEFEEALDFPSARDDLPEVAVRSLGPLHFIAIDPRGDLELDPIRARTAFLPWDRLTLAGARDYDVKAHWALYVENYLEGFHIPYVHADLNRVVDYGAYRTVLFEESSVQIGVGDGGFDLPEGHPDRGARVCAYYFWLFPTTMINVYPWGLSLNAIAPIDAARTRVSFFTWVWDESKRDAGAGGDLHQVELEDEAIVENVQRGIRSPLYQGGRYSPSRETGVHHFHRLLTRAS